MMGWKQKRDAMSNDGTQRNVNGKKIRKKLISKNWMEVNGHPCDGGPMDWLLIKGQRIFKTMWKKSLESYWSEELLQIYRFFSGDHLENKTESIG